MMGLMLLEMFIRLPTSLSCSGWMLSSVDAVGPTTADTTFLSSLKMENPSSFDLACFHEGDFIGDLRPFLIRIACAPRGLETDFWVLSVVTGTAALFLSVVTVDRCFTAMFGWLFSLLLLLVLLVCFK